MPTVASIAARPHRDGGGIRPQGYVGNPAEYVDPLGLTPTAHGNITAQGELDWSGTDPHGLSRSDHVKRHSVDNPNRNSKHGVFNGDPIVQAEDAWKHVKSTGMQPQLQGSRHVYDVPSPNAGIQGGNPKPGHGQTLNKIRIVTDGSSNGVITAFPV